MGQTLCIQLEKALPLGDDSAINLSTATLSVWEETRRLLFPTDEGGKDGMSVRAMPVSAEASYIPWQVSDAQLSACPSGTVGSRARKRVLTYIRLIMKADLCFIIIIIIRQAPDSPDLGKNSK